MPGFVVVWVLLWIYGLGLLIFRYVSTLFENAKLDQVLSGKVEEENGQVSFPQSDAYRLIEKYPRPGRLDDLAPKLTEHFTKAAHKAVEDLHSAGLSSHGEIDGVWQEVKPPEKK